MNEQLQEVAIDLSEVALDALTDNELIKEIPVISTFVRLAKATRSISDRIFAKKVQTFISSTTHVADEKRAEFHAALQANPNLRRRAGEAIVLALDRADDLQKTAIIGRLYSHFVAGEIPFDVLRRLLVAVDRAFIDDLLNFPTWALQQRALDSFDPRPLDGTGLVEPVYGRFGEIRVNETAAPKFGCSKLGQIYAKLLLGFEPEA
jgi:hypothetical protein